MNKFGFKVNQGYQYQSFPSFRNIDGNISAPINTYAPRNVLGETYELAVVTPKSKKHKLQKICNRFPSIGEYKIPNERSRIDEINNLIPINGDMIWGINPVYLGDTVYRYFGYTQLQIGLILDYEADVSKLYLRKLFSDTHRVNKLIRKILYVFNYSIQEDLINEKKFPDIFIKFCIDFKILDKRIDEIITGKRDNWDELRVYFDTVESFTEFKNELYNIDFQLFSCFSFLHTMKRINFLGICEVIEENKNDHELHFFRVRYQYHGEIQSFLLSPNMKIHAQCNCYWYRTEKTNPLKILIYDSYADLDLLKEKMSGTKEEIDNKEEIVIKRGCFIGQNKDSIEIPLYTKNMYFLMQQFPLKVLKEDIEVKTSEDIWNLIHKKQKRRLFSINVFY